MGKLEIILGDITKTEVDVIVNAANNSLLGGGGVDGAIHAAAGPGLLKECRLLNGCETGKAKQTLAYQLPAKYIIHTVGPIWRGGMAGEKDLLMSAYTESLKLAIRNNLYSIAFPAISCGVYAYPKKEASVIALQTVFDFLKNYDQLEVYFVLFSEEIKKIFLESYKEIIEK